jgi:hypothetical protein
MEFSSRDHDVHWLLGGLTVSREVSTVVLAVEMRQA